MRNNLVAMTYSPIQEAERYQSSKMCVCVWERAWESECVCVCVNEREKTQSSLSVARGRYKMYHEEIIFLQLSQKEMDSQYFTPLPILTMLSAWVIFYLGALEMFSISIRNSFTL